jgi:hypothetical protein
MTGDENRHRKFGAAGESAPRGSAKRFELYRGHSCNDTKMDAIPVCRLNGQLGTASSSQRFKFDINDMDVRPTV